MNNYLSSIQALQYNDLDSLGSLQPEGWADLRPIHEFYMKSDFCYPIKAMIGNKIAGIGTSIVHNNIAWLAHIIVHPNHRNQGIGKFITQNLVERVQHKNCDTIYLIATELGAPVYEKVGFITETDYLFFKDIVADSLWEISENIVAFTEDFKSQIAGLDRQVSTEDRMFHLQPHLESGYVYQRNNVVEGFYLPTFGEGLISAKTSEAGLALMKLRLTAKDTSAFPSDNLSATEFMHENNYREFKTLKRMRLGRERPWEPKNMYNRIGGNLG